MNRVKSNSDAPFQRPAEVARRTGIPISRIRAGVKDGSIPCKRFGRTCLVNLPAYLRQLGVTPPGDKGQTNNE